MTWNIPAALCKIIRQFDSGPPMLEEHMVNLGLQSSCIPEKLQQQNCPCVFGRGMKSWCKQGTLFIGDVLHLE